MIFETERLYLREFTLEDADEFGKVLLDKETMVHFDGDYKPEHVVKWIEHCMEDYTKIGHSFWAVIRKSDDQFLGDCGITMQTIDGEEVPEVGYHFNKAFWGKGYASEAAAGCIKYGFEKFSFPALYSYMTEGNKPSQKVAERAGMRQIKTYEADGKTLVVYRVDQQK